MHVYTSPSTHKTAKKRVSYNSLLTPKPSSPTISSSVINFAPRFPPRELPFRERKNLKPITKKRNEKK